MWIDKVVFFVGLAIAIAIIWYEFSRVKKSHDAETKNLHNQISELKEKNKEEQDKLFFAYEREKQELVENELMFFFKCDRKTSRKFYTALCDAHLIDAFFEAQTDEERIAVVDEARMQHNEKDKGEESPAQSAK